MLFHHLFILIIALSGIGFGVYQLFKRKKKEKYQPKDTSDDDPVEQIEKVLVLKIPLEMLLMGYFVLITLINGGLLITGSNIPGLDLTVLYLSSFVFIFLIFKSVIVMSTLKTFRTWVLFPMLLSGLIFILAWQGLDAQLTPLLNDALDYSLTIHLLGVILGVGGTLILDLMIFHFLRNFKITMQESVIMHLVSQMIIIGLILIIISGIAIMFSDLERYLSSGRFLMKITVVLVVIINGAFLNLYVTPKMEKISLKEGERGRYETLKYFAFIVGAVSMTSWLSAFFLAMIKAIDHFSYFTILITYLILLATAIAGGLFTKKMYEQKAKEQE